MDKARRGDHQGGGGRGRGGSRPREGESINHGAAGGPHSTR